MNKDFRIKNICKNNVVNTVVKANSCTLYDMIWSITFSADRNCTAWCDAKIFDGRFMSVSLSPILHVLSPHSHQGVEQDPGRVSLCICTGKNYKMRYEKTNRNEKVILWQVKIFLVRGSAARACLCPTSLKEVTVFCRKIHKYLWLGNSVKAQIQQGFQPLNVRTGAIMLIIF